MTTMEEQAAPFAGFAGELLRPGDAGYEEARRVHNALVDKRPALIARCRGVADVVATVGAAREQGLELSIRGGGHNVSGNAVTEGGLMLDLSLMRGIHVDPARQTARAQGGVTWAELNRETQVHGLAVTGGVVSTTGIAGLTLGGGLGWTMSMYGLAADNLLSAEVVTADGSVLTASEGENEDLFWGLRGAGANFGVVASFEYRLHPLGPLVTGGIIVHPFEAAGDLIRCYRDFTADLPDDVASFLGLIHAPDGSGARLAAVLVGHFGPAEEAQRALEPLLSFGSPLDVQVGPMPYTALNAMIDDGFGPGSLNYWKSTFVKGLPDEAVDLMVERFAACPSPMSAMVIEEFHGAVTRVPVEAMAVPHREQGYNIVIPSVWADPGATDENIAWTRETFAALQPYAAGRRYVNYLGSDEDDEAVRAAFGPNYDRLAQLKRRYDPENLFRLNQNIRPA